MTDTSPTTTVARRRLQPRHFAYVALVLVAAACLAIVATKGIDSATNLDDGHIERLIPSPGAKVLQQDLIGIDLAPGYEGQLTLNGVALPMDQVNWMPELNQLTFRPGAGKVVEQLSAGQNCMLAEYWPSAYGPTQSSRYTWCFTVV